MGWVDCTGTVCRCCTVTLHTYLFIYLCILPECLQRWKITVAGVQPVTGTTKEHAATTTMNEQNEQTQTQSQSDRASESSGVGGGESLDSNTNTDTGDSSNPTNNNNNNNEKEKTIPLQGKSVVNSIGIENVDLSFLIGKHTDYCYKMNTILNYIDLKSTTVSSSSSNTGMHVGFDAVAGEGMNINPLHGGGDSTTNATVV